MPRIQSLPSLFGSSRNSNSNSDNRNSNRHVNNHSNSTFRICTGHPSQWSTMQQQQQQQQHELQQQQEQEHPVDPDELSRTTLTRVHLPVHHHLSLSSMLLPPGAADLSVRRTISDSVLQRGLVRNYQNKNTIFMLVNRSGAQAVRQILADIERRCDEYLQQLEQLQQQQSSSAVNVEQVKTAPSLFLPSVVPPEAEVCILAQWADDAYYSVVIAGRRGIPTILKAMQVFQAHRGMQECCCLALGNLCLGSNGNLLALEQAGGVRHIVQAMRNHPHSVAVQAAACDALRNMSSLVLNLVQQEAAAAASLSATCPAIVMAVSKDVMADDDIDTELVRTKSMTMDLIAVLSNCRKMYLQPTHLSVAENLLHVLMMIHEQGRSAYPRALTSP